VWKRQLAQLFLTSERWDVPPASLEKQRSSALNPAATLFLVDVTTVRHGWTLKMPTVEPVSSVPFVFSMPTVNWATSRVTGHTLLLCAHATMVPALSFNLVVSVVLSGW
jgi:hypothetical protein